MTPSKPALKTQNRKKPVLPTPFILAVLLTVLGAVPS